MNDVVLLYLLTRLDDFNTFLFVTALVLIVLSGVAFMMVQMSINDDSYSFNAKKLEQRKQDRKPKIEFYKKAPIVAFVLVFVSVFIPSTKDVIFTKILEISRSQKVTAISEKTLTVIDQYLQSQIVPKDKNP